MISQKRYNHIQRLAIARKGTTNSKETILKRKETFRLKSLQRIKDAGDRFCLKCGKKLVLIVYPSGQSEGLCKLFKRKYCSLYCARHSKEFKERFGSQNNGNKNGNWKGGKNKRDYGYIEIWMPTHPYANHDGYVLEHRLVMENKLGRYLKPKEVVHHIDENTSNNDVDNLMLFKNAGYHINHHLRLKKDAAI